MFINNFDKKKKKKNIINLRKNEKNWIYGV